MKGFENRQRGLSFFGFIMLAMAVVFLAILGMKVVPPYLRSFQIQQIYKSISRDPAMQAASVKDIRESYIKRAGINYITDIRAEDIEVINSDGKLSLSSSYEVRIPLVANITLLLEFNPSSS